MGTVRVVLSIFIYTVLSRAGVFRWSALARVSTGWRLADRKANLFWKPRFPYVIGKEKRRVLHTGTLRYSAHRQCLKRKRRFLCAVYRTR